MSGNHFSRRLHIRSKDITKFGTTVNCRGCVATVRGAGGVPRSDSRRSLEKWRSSATCAAPVVGVPREEHPRGGCKEEDGPTEGSADESRDTVEA